MSTTEPDFGGRIGRTIADSSPWWPDPPAGLRRPDQRPGTRPNVVMIVLDDLGFAQLGCYGSTMATPHIDALAAGGVRHTGFHTTALCSPTRACLLTGRNHHTVGMRGVSNWNTGFPHMRGGIGPRTATIAHHLRDHGYATYAAGKWHLAPMDETSAAGPHHHWPLQQGFDRFYGFLQGETDQFHPELTHDNHHIDPPAGADDGYHVSADIVDQSMGWIRDLHSVRPDRPFFLYLAFGAMHAPHQAPPSYLDRWRGAFDEGYDVWRQRWYDRQVDLGVIPAETRLAPPNLGVPAWDELTGNQQRFSCRLQEAFAAMLEHTDHQIGRLVQFLDDLGELDDTLLMVLSDNGASREGGPLGVMDEFSFFNSMPEDIDEIVENRLDDIGGPHSHSNYPWGWAQAGNSPLRWYKQNTYGGGVRDPLIVHWPDGVSARGEIRPQFCHAIDLAATVLDATETPAPESFGGHIQVPIDGRTIRPMWDDADVPPPRPVQYFEQLGHRGIWADGWKATTFHWPGQPFDDDVWELFRLDDDFSECRDLAAEHPEKLREMVDTWWAEAGAHGVLPLDDRTIELFTAPARPGTTHDRDTYIYMADTSHVPADASPALGGRPWVLTAEVLVGDDPPRGVIYARGAHNVGHSFFVDEHGLHFDYNALGRHSRVSAPLELDVGRHTLTVRFDRVRGDTGATITIGADGTDLASVEVPKIVRILGSTGMDIGRDALSPVVGDYDAPFPFDGRIERVTFDIRSGPSPSDIAATAAAEFSKE
ncbi:MAG: arylsulfatase [Ilumatobacteraceae bacterium]